MPCCAQVHVNEELKYAEIEKWRAIVSSGLLHASPPLVGNGFGEWRGGRDTHRRYADVGGSKMMIASHARLVSFINL